MRIAIMSPKKRWQQHLNDLVTASLDPMVYAVEWARDPRCLGSASHPRIGRTNNESTRVCALSSNSSKRVWS
jgi:hypothetical protein